MGKIKVNIKVKDGINLGTSFEGDTSIDKFQTKQSEAKRNQAISRQALRAGMFAMAISRTELPEDKLAMAQLAVFNLATNKLTSLYIDTRSTRIEADITTTRTNYDTEAKGLTQMIGADDAWNESGGLVGRPADPGSISRLEADVKQLRTDLDTLQVKSKRLPIKTAIIGAGAEFIVDIASAGVNSVIQSNRLSKSIGRDVKNAQFARSLRGIRTVGEF